MNSALMKWSTYKILILFAPYAVRKITTDMRDGKSFVNAEGGRPMNIQKKVRLVADFKNLFAGLTLRQFDLCSCYLKACVCASDRCFGAVDIDTAAVLHALLCSFE